jgi:hypothetical protein
MTTFANMAIRTDSPQVAALKLAVEKRFGRVVQTRSDFSSLVSDIEIITHEHISENTLRRIYGKITGYETVFTRTLDVLSLYVGYKHWNAFLTSFNGAAKESDVVVGGELSIKTEDLKPGDRIRIAWLPDRECIVEYIDGRMFKAVSAYNSILQVGDTFECSMMLKNYPLFIDNLVHGGEICQRYLIGLSNGLTILEKL